MKITTGKTLLSLLTGFILFGASGYTQAVLTIPNTPLIATQVAKPLTMLVAGKDHKLFYEAYNDASDVDGDGTLDIRFKPSITYFGLFDPLVCYTHNDKSNNTGLFSPADTTTDGKCVGKKGEWSGNFLNYVTTSRIDALRGVLYGGYREVDSITQTILRRAYIPNDAHSWSKEYTSETVDKYKISDYTPLAQPKNGKRHFLGNLTMNKDINCSTLDTCSDLPPILAVVENSNKRVWEWASTERPVLEGDAGGTRTNRTVRVEVCTATYHNGCEQYPNGSYKPIGILHEYGETDAMYFGLLSGSYDKHMSGGRLRKVMSSFTNEVDKDTGVFKNVTGIVDTFNKLRIRGYNQSTSSQEYLQGNPYEMSAKAPTEGEFVDWGNPVGEMMYEATRYLAGKKSATTAFMGSEKIDKQVGLSSVTWDDPYDPTSTAKAPWCAKANLLTVTDINTSFDSDSLPGSYFGSFTGDLTSLNVKTIGDTITSLEPSVTGMHFIGQSETNADSAPTAKNVISLGTIRGLAPEEPNRQGSYYAASVAHYAKTTKARSAPSQDQIADTFVVALASPLPKIVAPLPNGKTITLVPFAKSVGGSNISSKKGDYQPTDQIVDFYVETIANSGADDKDASINSGRYKAKFRINYEDVEQGGDHDMDAIAEYEVTANADNTLTVVVTPTYQAGGIHQHMGYVISGTTKDGVYLVARDENTSGNYFLNVPDGKSPGYCDVKTPPAACATLPTIGSTASVFKFTPSDTPSATFLRDPLWYAAKWGGFVQLDNNKFPDLVQEWDSNGDGVPDTYNLVQNPLTLKTSLKKSFDSIVARSASAGNITSNGQQITTDSKVFQSTFNSAVWAGELYAYTINDSGVVKPAAWLASEHIPATRNIYTWNESLTKGVAFLWSDISATQKTLLGGNEDILKYLRGDQSKEIAKGGSFRNRISLLGDIVHSSPYYVKDTNTVYVGANDGMLHAYDATTGAEVFAYIPSAAYTDLKTLSSAFYSHKFFVDGEISVSSNTLTTGQNILVGALGRGGKALFGLDVSTPGSFKGTNALWEFADSTTNPQPDLGYVLGRAQIAKMNNGVVAAIVSNGYNSTNGSAVLYILNVSTGALISKIDTGATGDNGLSTPTVWDTDNNGTIDVVYAGDLKGNVWKFDLSSTDPVNWKLTNTIPLFIAKDSANKRQPITAQITIAVDYLKDDPNITKTFLFFGSGSYTFTTDPTNKDIQTWYGIIDDGSIISSRSELKERTIDLTGTSDGKAVRAFSEGVLTPNDMIGKKGWFIDLQDPSPRGERIVTSSQLITAIQPTLIVSSIIPDPDPCVPGGSGYLNAVNAFTGARLTSGFFDINGNGSFADDLVGGAFAGSIDLGVGMPGEGILVGDQIVVGGSSGEIKSIKINLGAKKTGRISWREIRQ